MEREPSWRERERETEGEVGKTTKVNSRIVLPLLHIMTEYYANVDSYSTIIEYHGHY